MSGTRVFTLLLASLIISAPANLSYSQNYTDISGRIVFESGETQSFEGVRFIKHILDGGTSMHSRPLRVEYKNSIREVGFSDLSRIRVSQYSVDTDRQMPQKHVLKSVSLEITTKTGVETETRYRFLTEVEVAIEDELTGEIKLQEIPFAMNDGLNIRSIEFN